MEKLVTNRVNKEFTPYREVWYLSYRVVFDVSPVNFTGNKGKIA